MKLPLALSVCFCFVLVALGCSEHDPRAAKQRRIAREIAEEIQSATAVEVYLLTPDDVPPLLETDQLMGRRHVTGATSISNRIEINKLANSLKSGIEQMRGVGPECWNPHHALRTKDLNGGLLVVLCFECAHGYVEKRDSVEWFEISRSTLETWDAIFAQNGLFSDHHQRTN